MTVFEYPTHVTWALHARADCGGGARLRRGQETGRRATRSPSITIRKNELTLTYLKIALHYPGYAYGQPEFKKFVTAGRAFQIRIAEDKTLDDWLDELKKTPPAKK